MLREEPWPGMYAKTTPAGLTDKDLGAPVQKHKVERRGVGVHGKAMSLWHAQIKQLDRWHPVWSLGRTFWSSAILDHKFSCRYHPVFVRLLVINYCHQAHRYNVPSPGEQDVSCGFCTGDLKGVYEGPLRIKGQVLATWSSWELCLINFSGVAEDTPHHSASTAAAPEAFMSSSKSPYCSLTYFDNKRHTILVGKRLRKSERRNYRCFVCPDSSDPHKDSTALEYSLP